MFGPAPFMCSVPPPPRRGFAIRDPAPPKLKPPDALDDDERPRVEPSLAASRRSLTAVSCTSNLLDANISTLSIDPPKDKHTDGSQPSTSLDCPVIMPPSS